MYQPQIQLTHEIAANLQRVEEMRRLINTIPVLPQWELSIRRQALVHTVHSTAAIEGNRLSLDQVDRLVEGVRASAADRDSVEIRNLAGLMPELYRFAREQVPADERLIREMNRRILEGVPGTDALTPGQYRRGQNYVEEASTRRVLFAPPDQGDVPALMAALSDWLQADQAGLAPLLKAGVAHLELVAIHPFNDGNGRVARALATYVMYSTGYDFRRFHSWETYLNADVAAYSETLTRSLGQRYGDAPDYTPWLEYFTEALAATLEALREEIEQLRHAWDTAFDAGSRLGFDQTQVQALILAAHYGRVTTESYGRVAHVSRATAYRHLRELAAAGLLRQEGQGRAAHYVATELLRRGVAPAGAF